MPIIKLDHCIKCLKCVNDCPSNAIDIEVGSIDATCIHCGHCVAICPESTLFPDIGEIKKLQPEAISPEDLEHLAARVRTCRSYLAKEVDTATIEQIVENMKQYPSASNSRPVEIMHVKSEEMVQKLNDNVATKLIETLGLITSPIVRAVLKIVAPKVDTSALNSYKKSFKAKHIPGASLVCHHAPSVMIFHAPVSKFGMAAADAYIWATYTTIYAQTLGLGTCFNGFIVKGMERSKTMRKEFGIPANHQVYAALLLGYPKVKYVNEVGRTKPNMKTI
jgi:ferredoxin